MPVKHHTQTAISDDPAYDISKDEWNMAHDVTSGSAVIPAQNKYVDIPHGLGSTPDLNKIHIMPQDNLQGKSVWPSDPGPVTFRINMSSMDTIDHTFGYVIL